MTVRFGGRVYQATRNGAKTGRFASSRSALVEREFKEGWSSAFAIRWCKSSSECKWCSEASASVGAATTLLHDWLLHKTVLRHQKGSNQRASSWVFINTNVKSRSQCKLPPPFQSALKAKAGTEEVEIAKFKASPAADAADSDQSVFLAEFIAHHEKVKGRTFTDLAGATKTWNDATLKEHLTKSGAVVDDAASWLAAESSKKSSAKKACQDERDARKKRKKKSDPDYKQARKLGRR